MKLRCPVCHSSNSLEAYASDDAGRELLATLAGTGPLFRPLVHYLGLFRAPSRDLSNDRALKLITDVLAIGADPHQLAAAMSETVEAMRAKRNAGQVKPLTNHNYLKRVLETVATPSGCACHPSEGGESTTTPSGCACHPSTGGEFAPILHSHGGGSAGRGGAMGKRARSIAALEDWGRDG